MNWPLSFLILCFVLLIVGGIAYERMLWNECRATPHTWFYCLRVVPK
jgi:uncharacterized protein (DUF983 family)